jgi:predicted nucleic acid-binding protein
VHPARPVFFDTSYFVAMIDVRDGLNSRTRELSRRLLADRVTSVTSDPVLIEVGNYFSRTSLRPETGVWLTSIRNDPGWDIVPLDNADVLAAVARYRRYDDKSWSMTDCLSMEVMGRRRIREIATSDQGFAQAGFTVLMV